MWHRRGWYDWPGDLIPRHDLPCRRPVTGGGGGKGEFDKRFTAYGPLYGQGNRPGGLGGNWRDGNRAGMGDGAIDYDAPGAVQIGEGGVEAAIFDAKHAVGTVAGGDAYGAREIHEFAHAGVGHAVGPDHAVGHKVAVVGYIAEAAAVDPVGLTGRRMHADAVVEPFPDEAPLQTMMLLECGVIVGQRATAVAHGVGVFTQN